MDVNKLNKNLNNWFSHTLPNFFKTFPQKFKRMSLGEQIAHLCIVLGGLLIIISLFLF